MNKTNMKWKNPELLCYDVEELLKHISIRAGSDTCKYDTLNDDYCTYDVLKEGYGGTEGGGSGLGGNETICIEIGPLGGCANWAACQYVAILSIPR